MALPLKRTLGEMRADIQVRLGFGMAGNSGVVNSPLIDSMLRSAQEQLYTQFDWAELKGVDVRNAGVNQQYYDYPANCNIERIQRISIRWGGQTFDLHEGIETSDRDFPSSTVPRKYERRDQIELWPIPQAAYELRTEYIKTLNPFINNSDRCSLPDQIVYLHALANAKMHYRQPDASSYMSQLESTLMKLKDQNRSRTVFSSVDRIRSPYDYSPDASQRV